MMQIGMILGFFTSYPAIGGWLKKESNKECSGNCFHFLVAAGGKPIFIFLDFCLLPSTCCSLEKSERQSVVGPV
jgi:hypothetical protein